MAQPHYDKIATSYDGAIRPLERWFLSRLREEALSYIPGNAFTLEVGTGTGLNFRYYSSGARGIASELSFEMLRLAAEKDRPQKYPLFKTTLKTCLLRMAPSTQPFQPWFYARSTHLGKHWPRCVEWFAPAA